MKRYIYLILFLFIVGLTACQKQSHILPLLQEAETLMDSRPDSSLCLLESVQSPENLSAAEYATWCLLVTQARDKNYVEHTSDSLIGVAVRYFEKQKDPLRYAKALYYEGRIYQDLGDIEKAMFLFVKSLDIGKQTSDYLQLFLTSSRLGTLYARLNVQDKAMNAYHDALQYAFASCDSSSISYGYSYIGRAYSLSEEWEQSLVYYEKALLVATQIKDFQAMELAMNEYVAVCVNADRYDKISDYVNRLLKAKQEGNDKVGNLEQFYFTIGDLYRHVGKADEAILYLEKALQSDNLHTLSGSSQCLYFLYEEQKQYEKAVQYNNKYWMYIDSIQKIENKNMVLEIEAKYNYEKMQKENLQLQLQNVRIVCEGILGLLVLLGIVFAMIKIYRRRLKDKIQLVSELREQLEVLQNESSANLQNLEENQAEALVLSRQIETLQQEFKKLEEELRYSDEHNQIEVDKLSRQLKEKAVHIDQIEGARSMLINKNKKLEEKNLDLKEMIHALQEKFSIQISNKNSDTPNMYSFSLIVKMRAEEASLQDEEWEELLIIVNLLHKNFVDRLSVCFPKLNSDDIKLCCLTKLMFTNEEISSFLDIQKDAVIKRKQRLKPKFGKESWGKGGFDSFIDDF
ncbi:tetratricopeptide repeat protein [Parabacteroides sp. AF17-28]|uniref:tetratricopeptide repeat protein n=1 Tax=Parabacteroides sp. AF17-28 TaxID=2292241 RepID=UPI000EFF0B3F|nr:tetratricopeptide repeat protein [Parabacteroides sp. AF17-28]